MPGTFFCFTISRGCHAEALEAWCVKAPALYLIKRIVFVLTIPEVNPIALVSRLLSFFYSNL